MFKIRLTEQEEAVLWDLVEEPRVLAAVHSDRSRFASLGAVRRLIVELRPEVKSFPKEPFGFDPSFKIAEAVMELQR